MVLFGALLAGRLVVVARGLYLARHLFTLSATDLLFPPLVYGGNLYLTYTALSVELLCYLLTVLRVVLFNSYLALTLFVFLLFCMVGTYIC